MNFHTKQSTINYLTKLEDTIKYQIGEVLDAKIVSVDHRSLTVVMNKDPAMKMSLRFTTKKAIFENISGNAVLPLDFLNDSKYLVALGKQLNSVGHTIAIIKSSKIK